MPQARRKKAASGTPIKERATAYARPAAAILGVLASLVTVIAWLGFGPNSEPSVEQPRSEAAANEQGAPLVSITSAALLQNAEEVSYQLTGTAVGVTDPPWKVYVIARPSGPTAETEGDNAWWVSTEVVPEADGRWSALLFADVLPPGTTGVTFEPLLVTSPGPTPPPTVPPTSAPGSVRTLPPVNTEGDPIQEALSIEGSRASVVVQVFEELILRVQPSPSS